MFFFYFVKLASLVSFNQIIRSFFLFEKDFFLQIDTRCHKQLPRATLSVPPLVHGMTIISKHQINLGFFILFVLLSLLIYIFYVMYCRLLCVSSSFICFCSCVSEFEFEYPFDIFSLPSAK